MASPLQRGTLGKRRKGTTAAAVQVATTIVSNHIGGQLFDAATYCMRLVYILLWGRKIRGSILWGEKVRGLLQGSSD